ncbi:MAG: hypothetical protein KDD60_11155, partial [Bdellovibrionales bacterium]|nr:hypothetical protein [Bdellovibrionales bacterium]
MYEAQKEANVAWLFQTEAFKVSPEDKPFSFTSGLLGPYFIATHYLCGGSEVAESILDAITEEAEDRAAFPQSICEVLHEAYARHD